MSKGTPIAIVGMACRYPGADDLKSFWENILARRRQFRDMPDVRLPLAEYYDPDPAVPDKMYCKKAALIDGFSFDWASHRIPKTTIESSDITHWLALDISLKALKDAGYEKGNVPNEKSGVVLGNTLTGEYSRSEGLRLRWPYVRKSIEAAAKAKGLPSGTSAELLHFSEQYYKSTFAPVTEDTLAGGLSNTIAGRICNYFDFHGGGYTVDGACSSSLIAVATAATSLANDELDIVLAGGVDISLDTFELIGFSKTGALSMVDMSVYDRRADGFFPGEGCGFVVLKRLEDALNDSDHIYAVLHGWGISSDGKGGLTAPNARGQATALKRAYGKAKYSIHDVDFFEGHGTGTAVGDRTELEGISIALGSEKLSDSRRHGITSLKSIVGHTKAASGIGGFIKTVAAVNRRVLPPTANCLEPNPVFQDTAKNVYPLVTGEVCPPSKKLRAGISAMGFGGINCHVTVESYGEPSPRLSTSITEQKLIASHQATEIFPFGAPSAAELLEKINHLEKLSQGLSIGELPDLAHKLSVEFDPTSKVRACMATGNPDILSGGLQFLSRRLKKNPLEEGEIYISRRQDIFAGNNVQKNRVGFLFPGQGSQQLNMSRRLVERYEWARELVNDATDWLKEIRKRNVAPLMFRSLEKAASHGEIRKWQNELKQSQVAQPAICLASMLYVEYLRRLGILPEAVGGHSLGELTAFYAAGVLDEKSLIQLAAIRGLSMAMSKKGKGKMASLACSLETAQDIIQDIEGYVVVANINSPTQTIISGDSRSVALAVDKAKGQNISTHMLQVSNAFHSSYVKGTAKRLGRNTPLPEKAGNMAAKIFSCMGGKLIEPGQSLPDHFADQVISQVDFTSLLQSMHKECDLFVEVGPGKVLSNLVKANLHSKNLLCVPLESQPGHTRDFNIFLARYFVQGGNINWDELYQDRLIRPFLSTEEREFFISPCERPFAVDPDIAQLNVNTVELLESTLSDTVDIPPQQLRHYLEQRGKFLEGLIRVDMENMPDSSSTIHNRDMNDERNSKGLLNPPSPTEPLTEFAITNDNVPVEQVILELIQKRTGFPRESLSLDLRLLDDLNLDSIKSAEVVATAAQQLKIEGQIDPSQFAQSTIREVAVALTTLCRNETHTSEKGDEFTIPQKENSEPLDRKEVEELFINLISERTGFPPDSLTMEMSMLDDLNLDSIKTAELVSSAAQKLNIADQIDPGDFARSTVAEVVSLLFKITSLSLPERDKQVAEEAIAEQTLSDEYSQSWVRNFEIRYTEESLPQVNIEDLNNILAEKQLLLLCETDEMEVALSIQKELSTYGASSEIRTYKNYSSRHDLTSQKWSNVVSILPRKRESDVSPNTIISSMINRIHTAISCLHSSSPGEIIFVQFGNGSFGMQTKLTSIEQCCASAMAESLFREREHLKVRVVDMDSTVSPDQIASLVLQESAQNESYVKCGYDQNLKRYIPEISVLEPASYTDRSLQWFPNDVILVTGGAKGITAECVREFLKTKKVKLALVGRTQSGDSKIKKALEQFKANGIECNYYSCNVADPDMVTETVNMIHHDLGSITGVIHGAAVNIPRRCEQVSADEALKEVGPKILGALYLMEALRENQLKMWIGFSSIIGVTGMQGNAWYGFSNEVLDVILYQYSLTHPQTEVQSLAYGIWDEVGMGYESGSIDRLKNMGIEAIPASEGITRFIQLLEKSPGNTQTIISPRSSFHSHDFGEVSAGTDIVDKNPLSFIEQVVFFQKGIELTTRTHLTLEKDSYLEDHVWKGSYLFPTVFGLEAMMQVAERLLEKPDLNLTKLTDIRLDRPIPVNPENGTVMEVQCELLEREDTNEDYRLKVGIRTDQTGFRVNHFQSTFVFGKAARHEISTIDFPEKPLSISPQLDLYGRFLFQGGRFQCIQEVYELQRKQDGTGQCLFLSEPINSNAGKDTKEYPNRSEAETFGNPYIRDTMLQSIQLLVPEYSCLPVAIERIERTGNDVHPADAFWIKTELLEQSNEHLLGEVSCFDCNGKLIEKIYGYKLRILDHMPENPSLENLLSPEPRDQKLIEEGLVRIRKLLQNQLPAASIKHFPGIHNLDKNKRHQHEIPLLKNAVNEFGQNSDISLPDSLEIDWNISGKPFIKDPLSKTVDISVAHDDNYILCVAGQFPQGCDISPLLSREKKDWLAILGEKSLALLEQLLTLSETYDRAGTRIWAATEAVKKASGLQTAVIKFSKRLEDDIILFESPQLEKDQYILTFSVSLTLGPEKIIALVVNSPNFSESQPGAYSDAKGIQQHIDNIWQMNINSLGDGKSQEVVQIYPLSFKETQGASGGIYHTNYFDWFGKLREVALSPIMGSLSRNFETGRWGLVTNNVDLKVYNDARVDDVIKASLWLISKEGPFNSNILLGCQWHKVSNPDNPVLLATATMKTGWVEIDSKGLIRLAPLPDYFEQFLESSYSFKEKDPDTFGNKGFRQGKTLYDSEIDPKGPSLIHTAIFETNQEHTTPLRNIYYSNFPKWQGEALTNWFHKNLPDICRNQNANGELMCAGSRVEYLREAMVYDEIHISMSLKALHENGCNLSFDFYRFANQAREKLAKGEMDMLWVTRSDEGNVSEGALPKELRHLFLMQAKPDYLSLSYQQKGVIEKQHEKSFEELLIDYQEKMDYFSKLCAEDPFQKGTTERHEEFSAYLTTITEQLKIFQKNADSSKLTNMRNVFQKVVLQNLGDSIVMRHSLEKPLGYAGDFKLLDMLVNNDLQSTGIGYHFDRFQLNNPSSVACRKRVEWVSDELLSISSMRNGHKFRILDLGIGAAPIERRLSRLKTDLPIDIIAVDMEPRALEFVQAELADEYKSVRPIQLNLKKEESLKRISEIANDITCCIAVGILEALTEAETISLMSTLLSSMPKGSLIYAEKYLPTHPARDSMEWFMDFYLGYSSPEALKEMVLQAGSSPDNIQMIEDPSGTIVTLKVIV